MQRREHLSLFVSGKSVASREAPQRFGNSSCFTRTPAALRKRRNNHGINAADDSHRPRGWDMCRNASVYDVRDDRVKKRMLIDIFRRIAELQASVLDFTRKWRPPFRRGHIWMILQKNIYLTNAWLL